MHSDLDDTLTGLPAAVAPPVAEPDVEHTLVPAAAPELDPHMWPADAAPAAWLPAAPAAAPTPLFYGFRIGNSQVVLLDAIAYVGRKPTMPRVLSSTPPRLVRVQSPTHEVSSTHLELRQVGTAVIAHDLRSTNGTMIAVPGHPVRALRPGESAVVTVGTLIDIGDRNVIEILPLRASA